MKKNSLFFLALCGFMCLCGFLLPPKSVFDFNFKLKNIDEEEVSLSQYKGKVLLIVNVASKCGLTPQYEELQKLYENYQGQGLEILAFPANDFLRQEPGKNADIKEFCQSKYSVTFPIFAKISVKGKDMHPLYKFLTQKSQNGLKDAPVSWNFQKFLLDKDGKLVEVFSPRTNVTEPEVKTAIEKLLGK